MTPEQFISAIAPAAVAFMRKTRISAALVIAQGGLESGFGKAAKAMGNNIFGIKADAGWKGPTTLQDTREFVNGKWITIKARFRSYPSIQACLEDHNSFLLQTRYKNLVGADYKTACHLIAAVDHYATDPDYEQKLLDIIEQYDLQKYDEEASTVSYPPVKVIYHNKQYSAVAIKDVTYVIWKFAKDFGCNLTRVKYNDVEIDGKKPRQWGDGTDTYIFYGDIPDVKAVKLPDKSGWEFVHADHAPANPKFTTQPWDELELFDEIPMDVIGSALYFIPKTSDGTLGHLQLDTGAFETLVGSNIQDPSKVPGIKERDVTGVGGIVKAYEWAVDIVMGGQTFKQQPCVIMPSWDWQSGSDGLFGEAFWKDNHLVPAPDADIRKLYVFKHKGAN